MTRLDELLEKYHRHRLEVEAGTSSLKQLEETAKAMSDLVIDRTKRVRMQREQSHFGRIEYSDAEYAADQESLAAERERLDALQLEAGQLRRQVREQAVTLQQIGALVVQEQRRTAAPLVEARKEGLVAEIVELLPRLGAILAIADREQPELYSGPSRVLQKLERAITDRRAYREEVHRHYADALRAVGLDADIVT